MYRVFLEGAYICSCCFPTCHPYLQMGIPIPVTWSNGDPATRWIPIWRKSRQTPAGRAQPQIQSRTSRGKHTPSEIWKKNGCYSGCQMCMCVWQRLMCHGGAAAACTHRAAVQPRAMKLTVLLRVHLQSLPCSRYSWISIHIPFHNRPAVISLKAVGEWKTSSVKGENSRNLLLNCLKQTQWPQLDPPG